MTELLSLTPRTIGGYRVRFATSTDAFLRGSEFRLEDRTGDDKLRAAPSRTCARPLSATVLPAGPWRVDSGASSRRGFPRPRCKGPTRSALVRRPRGCERWIP